SMTVESQKVQSYFQRQAKQFDSLYDENRWMFFVNRVLRKGVYGRVLLTLREMEGTSNFTVLDVGCGSGRNSALFVEAGAARVAGIDVSDQMIELAHAYVEKKGVAERCQFVSNDFHNHFFSEKFDFVVALGVFDYMAEPVCTLRRMVDVAGRRVIASFPCVSLVRMPLRKVRYATRNCPLYFYDRKSLERVAEEAGLLKYRVEPYSSSGFLLIGDVRPAYKEQVTMAGDHN